jgi:hypothetical protein
LKVGGGVWFAATLAGFGRGAASKAGLFCASSEEEDFRRVMKEGGAWVAAMLAGFGRDATTKAGLFCASYKEEGFGRAMKLEG